MELEIESVTSLQILLFMVIPSANCLPLNLCCCWDCFKCFLVFQLQERKWFSDFLFCFFLLSLASIIYKLSHIPTLKSFTSFPDVCNIRHSMFYFNWSQVLCPQLFCIFLGRKGGNFSLLIGSTVIKVLAWMTLLNKAASQSHRDPVDKKPQKLVNWNMI